MAQMKQLRGRNVFIRDSPIARRTRSRNIYTELQTEGDTPTNPLVEASQSFNQDPDLIYGSSSQAASGANRITLWTPTSQRTGSSPTSSPGVATTCDPTASPTPTRNHPATQRTPVSKDTSPTPSLETLSTPGDHIACTQPYLTLSPLSFPSPSERAGASVGAPPSSPPHQRSQFSSLKVPLGATQLTTFLPSSLQPAFHLKDRSTSSRR